MTSGVDVILETYRWDDISPHQFLMTLDYVIEKVLHSPDKTWSYIENAYVNEECPTITERCLDCILHFLQDFEVVYSYEDEGIVYVTC